MTKPAEVARAFAKVCERFGGVDIVVSNAGAAWQGRIGDVSDELLRQSFELNFFAHQTVAKEAVRIMLQQGTGGALLFNLSKQAVNPGTNFGPYGLPKAATMLLDAPIRARLRQGRHPLERRQCRPGAERALDRRHDRGPGEGERACRKPSI